MLELHPLLFTADSVPAWLAAAYYGFWVGLPALLRWLFNLETNTN
ncbi:MAG: hypothetical protein U1E66_07275 [Rhodospirillales bacterium]